MEHAPNRVLAEDFTAKVTRLIARLRQFNVSSMGRLRDLWKEDPNFLRAELEVWLTATGKGQLYQVWRNL